MDKEKLQKEIVDAISQIAKNEASKNNKITIVKGEITGVDPLNCYYNFSYNNHLYSARSVLGGYSVGQKVFVAFSGEQENNIILCGEIIGGGTVAGSEERVLSSITQQYYISNSSEIEPPQNPGEGAQYQWSDERLEPTKGAPYLWIRYKYVYTDASIEYSRPYVDNLSTDLEDFKEEYIHYTENNDQKWENTLGKITTIEGQVKENTSSIEQNADNIILRAQETTELKNNLETNYYTKKESDAAIKVSSDSIISTVSSQISSIESNAIKTTVNYYLQNNGETPSKTDPSWSTSQPNWVNGKHIWLKVRTTKVDGTVSESDPVDLTGSTGATGAPGTNGVGIVSVTQQYYQSNSDTQAPSGDSGWSTTQPDYVEGKYIWIRYDTLLNNGSHSYSTPTLDRNLNGVYGEIQKTASSIKQTTDSISLEVEGIAKDYTKKSEILLTINESGETGVKISADKIDMDGVVTIVGDSGFVTETQLRTPGATVIDGGNIYADSITIGSFDTDLKDKVNNNIQNVRIQYALSNSNTTPPATGWQDNAPEWQEGHYIWQRTETTLADGTTRYSDALCITGVKGDTGSTGATGTGVSSITVEFYLSNSKTTQTGGSWTTKQPTWAPGKYLWTRQKITYKNPTATAYTTPTCDSSWEAVNEVEVGGKNILLRTKEFAALDSNSSSTNGGLRNGATAQIEQYKGFTVRGSSSVPVNASVLIYAEYMVKDINFGDIFTFSFYAKGTANNIRAYFYGPTGYVPAKVITSSQKATPNGYSDGSCNFKPSTKWTREWVTWEIGSEDDYGDEKDISVGKYVLLRSDGNTVSDANCYICGLKLEKGNKVTDWTPAPEDVQEGINNAQNSANKAQSSANNAQNTANNAASSAGAAQSAAENAQQAANDAQQAADNAQEIAGNAQQIAMEAQAASDKANELASGATAGLQQISQVFYADSTGAHVKAANDNETVIQSDGMHVMVGNTEVARFTRDDSHVDNLAIGRFLMFGAHRAEVYEQDGELGTGFFYIGDVQ